MPILQNKIVMKSIEALHDEALSLMPVNASISSITAPPAILHGATPPQESAIDAPKDTSEGAPPESARDHDIMARIEHLLKKLDEDDDAIAPPANEGPQSNVRNVTSVASHAATADNIATNNPASLDSPVLSDATKHANENATLNVTLDGMVEDTADKPFGETDDDASDDATEYTSEGMFSDDQLEEAASPDQTKALADIAEAIYQARQQAVDSGVANVSQNNATPSDMDLLSATIADEVGRTVSAVLTTELPKMLRGAVGETIRELRADARNQSTPTAGKPPKAKGVTARKTAAIKKAGTKKPTAKKAKSKTPKKKKLSSKKGGINKATAKKTAPSI